MNKSHLDGKASQVSIVILYCYQLPDMPDMPDIGLFPIALLKRSLFTERPDLCCVRLCEDKSCFLLPYNTAHRHSTKLVGHESRANDSTLSLWAVEIITHSRT